MRVKYLFALALWMFTGFAIQPVHAEWTDDLRGHILLQVEDNGEAWYVLPDTAERFYIKSGDAAYAALRNFGLGISDVDLLGIPIGVLEPTGAGVVVADTDEDGLADKLEEAIGTDGDNVDSDGDGFTDYVEVTVGYDPIGSSAIDTNSELVERLKGYILLQVESRGEAWYVNPDDGKRYYMADGDWAYEIMRQKSLGITNSNLSYVPIYDGTLDCGESIDCMIGSIEAFTNFSGTIYSEFELFGVPVQSWGLLTYNATRGEDGRYSWTTTTTKMLVDGVGEADETDLINSCRSNDYSDLIDILELAQVGSYSTEQPSTMICETVESE